VRAVRWLLDRNNGSNKVDTFVLAIPATFDQEWSRNVWKAVVGEPRLAPPEDVQEGRVSRLQEGNTIFYLCTRVRQLFKTYNCTPTGPALRISTEIGSASSTSQRKTSMQAGRDDARNPQDSSFRTNLSESQTLYESPMDVVRCDGWCGYDIIQHPTVVPLVRAICAW